jgi:hypothetical protein
MLYQHRVSIDVNAIERTVGGLCFLNESGMYGLLYGSRMVRSLGQYDDSDMDRGKSGGTRSALRAWRLSYRRILS